ncbi:39S ribosomal protein L9, mitochondrial isoform X2 [Trachypithecus francoisi]|uniref:39S ribosomal protein L9, mitochondrial isoform X2 n=1 Tax=Trachypithecus francoisi TaxID=54180 RepID=UPI00141B84A8|nr:39S ribosomal protein L9, mitochondrial isoform X2 [Trachypithecus francoisi]
MAALVVTAPGRALLRAGTERLLRGGIQELLRPRHEGNSPGLARDFSLSQNRGTVIVERWWKVPLAGEGRKPRLHRRHRVYKLVEDTKHGPKENLELILTQSVENIGVRGDLVSVKKSLGRNQLLPQGLAVYASPENKKLFEEEKSLRQEGKLEKIQTKAGEATVKFLKSCRLEVGMKNNVKWELNPEIVARHFFKNLGVVVAPHTLKLPEEPITRWGEYWCEVTVMAARNKADRDKANKNNTTPALVWASVAMVMLTSNAQYHFRNQSA